MHRFTLPLAVAVLACSVPLSARAETYDPTPLTATQILERARDATGKRAPGDYKEIASVHGGGLDTTVTTVWIGSNVKTTVAGGGFTSSYGIYQKQSWTQNENGIVTLRSNFHSAVNPDVLALEHPDSSDVHVLGITQTQPRQYVIEVHPANGNDSFRYYDVTTGLISQTVSYAADRYRHVTEYSDYRKTFGTMVAYRVHAYDGRPQNDSVRIVESYAHAEPSDDAAMPQPASLFAYSGASPLRLPATFTRQGVLIQLTIDGRGMDFLLDSGAAGLFIDPGVVASLGLKSVGRATTTIGGDIDIGRVRIPHITLGPLSIDDAAFSTSPFDQNVDGRRVVGLIGFDFLASGIFGLDFKQQTLTLYPSSGFDPKAMGLAGVGVELDDGVPRATMTVEGVQGHFAVDTGSFATLAYKPFVDRLPSSTSESNSASIEAVGGTVRSRVLDVTDLIFGGVRYKTGQIIEPSTSTFNIEDYDGLIGRDILYNYRDYFDYADGMIYLKETVSP